jgi:hypothetical protein
MSEPDRYARLEWLIETIRAETDVIKRLHYIQERINLEKVLYSDTIENDEPE